MAANNFIDEEDVRALRARRFSPLARSYFRRLEPRSPRTEGVDSTGPSSTNMVGITVSEWRGRRPLSSRWFESVSLEHSPTSARSFDHRSRLSGKQSLSHPSRTARHRRRPRRHRRGRSSAPKRSSPPRARPRRPTHELLTRGCPAGHSDGWRWPASDCGGVLDVTRSALAWRGSRQAVSPQCESRPASDDELGVLLKVSSVIGECSPAEKGAVGAPPRSVRT